MNNNIRKDYKLKCLYKASLSRHFDNQIFNLVKNKKITFPVYLSAGQEYVASSVATFCEINKIKPLLFGQHRCHSIYISFNGNLKIIDSFEIDLTLICPIITLY